MSHVTPTRLQHCSRAGCCLQLHCTCALWRVRSACVRSVVQTVPRSFQPITQCCFNKEFQLAHERAHTRTHTHARTHTRTEEGEVQPDPNSRRRGRAERKGNFDEKFTFCCLLEGASGARLTHVWSVESTSLGVKFDKKQKVTRSAGHGPSHRIRSRNEVTTDPCIWRFCKPSSCCRADARFASTFSISRAALCPE